MAISNIIRNSQIIKFVDVAGVAWLRYDRDNVVEDFVARGDETLRAFGRGWWQAVLDGGRVVNIGAATVPLILAHWEDQRERDMALRDQRHVASQRLRQFLRAHMGPDRALSRPWEARRGAETFALGEAMA